MNFPFFPPPSPTHMHTDAYLHPDLCGSRSLRLLFWKKWGLFYFFNAKLVTPSLSEAFHILLTRPFTQVEAKETPVTTSKQRQHKFKTVYIFPLIPQSFHTVQLIKCLLFPKQITFVTLQTSATNSYPPVLFISRVQRPIDFFHERQTQAPSFHLCCSPCVAVFGSIWRTRENNREKRLSKEQKWT